MCMMELATKTMTAESRMGSQRAARGTMCNLLQGCKNECQDFAREATTVERVRSRGPKYPVQAPLSRVRGRQARMESSSRLRRKSATCCTNAVISGCGFAALDESCGWNNVATKNKWAGDSIALHSSLEPRATTGKPA